MFYVIYKYNWAKDQYQVKLAYGQAYAFLNEDLANKSDVEYSRMVAL